MTEAQSVRWQPIRTAPRDGTLVLVQVRASEQGAGERDMVRWAKSARSGEESWVATDSDPEARIAYADNELTGWMPLPVQPSRAVPVEREPPTPEETDGSGV